VEIRKAKENQLNRFIRKSTVKMKEVTVMLASISDVGTPH